MKKASIFKKSLAIFLAALTVMSFSVSGFAANAEKVTVDVASNGQNVVSGKVFDDYSALLEIKKGATVDADEVTASITMTDVETLGIDGTKSYTKTVKTGVEKKVLLDNYLPSFTSATVSGTIDGVAYSYNFEDASTNSKYAIKATPADNKAVREAWAKIASHITTSEQTNDDSYAVIPGTAYVQIGAEKLSFEDTKASLKLDNIVSGSGITQKIRDAVKLEEVEELDDAQAEIYVPAGTVLALGQTVATLKDAATIKIYGYKDSADVNTILSKLRDCKSTEEVILTLVTFLSDAVNAIDGEEITVNIDFENKEPEKPNFNIFELYFMGIMRWFESIFAFFTSFVVFFEKIFGM